MKIKHRKKVKILLRDGCQCVYCDTKLTKDNFTVDHVLPKKHGGTDSLKNLAASCRDCNDKKGKLLLTQFIKAFDIKITESIARFL